MYHARIGRRPAAILQLLPLLIIISAMHGQEPTPSPVISLEEARHLEAQRTLNRELEIANLQKQIAEARKATLDALPQTRSTPLTGAVTMASENILTDIMVYNELDRVLVRIAQAVKATVQPNSTIIIYDKGAFADWMFYRRSLPLFKVVIEDLSSDYCRIAQSKPVRPQGDRFPGLSSGLAQSGNVVGQFADLISYFRTETTITGTSIAVSENAAVAGLFPKLTAGSGLTVLYPKSFGIDSPVICGESSELRPCCVPSATNDCREKRPKYCSEVARAFDTLYRSRQAALAARPQAADLRNVEESFKDFLSLFVAESTPNVDTVIKKYVNAEQFAAAVENENTYFLEVVPIKATGSTRVRKNLFFLSDKVDYAGGVVVQWTLIDRNGKLKNSGIESGFRGYLTPKQMVPVTP